MVLGFQAQGCLVLRLGRLRCGQMVGEFGMDGDQPGAGGTWMTSAGSDPDPDDASSLRYWDAQTWTAQRAPRPTAPPPLKKWWGVIVLVALLLALVAVGAAAGRDSGDSNSPATVPEASATVLPAGSPVATLPAVAPVTMLPAGSPVATLPAVTPVATVVAVPAPTSPPSPVTLAACVQVSELSPNLGSRGEVARYQQTLKNLGFDPGVVDGRFGPNTFAAGLAESSANGTGGLGVEFFPDDSAILEAAIVRLGISCNPSATPPPSTSPPSTSPPSTSPPATSPTLALNAFVTMQANPAEDVQFFDLVVGDRLIVGLFADRNGPADPFIRLLDPSGFEIAFDDDSGGGLDAQIDVVVSQSGSFTLFYSSLGASGRGQLQSLIN